MPNWIRGVLHLLCALPMVSLLVRGATGGLLPDPADPWMHLTGEWGVRLLILTLAVSPLAHWAKRPHLVVLRRPLGLWCFAYASLHMVGFVVLESGMSMQQIAAEIAEESFLLYGMATFVALVPLAATSTRAARRRMGNKAWNRLHALIYPAALLILGHLWGALREEWLDIAMHGGAILALLLLRWPLWRARRAAGGRDEPGG